VAVSAVNIWGPGGHGPMASTVARAYNGGPGTEVGIRGAKPPWSWSTFRFWAFNGSCKFAHFL